MKALLDTNVIVASVVQQHQSHTRAYVILDRVQSGKAEGFVSAHTLAETYAVLTKAPPPFRHSPEQALLSIEENVVKFFTITALSGQDYTVLIRDAAVAGIQGGTIYDAVLFRCAVKAEVDKLFTFNVRHFQNIAPEGVAIQIVSP